MKKSRSMRLASALLVLTLLSTCMISGTFAKYVTTASASDTARVAKWGVQVAATTDLFKEDYDTDDKNGTFKFNGQYSVSAAADDRDNLVAPGTRGSMTFSITGTPEVAVNVTVNFDKDDVLEMVTLPAETYTDYTKATYATDATATGYNEKFTVSDYNPVKWTLKKANTEAGLATATAVVDAGNLEAIEAYFDATTISTNYPANTNLTDTFGYYELSWEWPYEATSDVTLYDAADTYLGNVAAGVVTDGTVNLEEAFKLEISVTQID